MHPNSILKVNIHFNDIQIERSWLEYQALPHDEWRKDLFCFATGGYVATHVLKEKDNLHRSGIVAEVNACLDLAFMGKHILRLPENIPELIDKINITDKPFRKLLKFKPGETQPRGYPDVLFDNQTWDFKISTYRNVDTIRQLIKDGRKADNVIFITTDIRQISTIMNALYREFGNRQQDDSWIYLPDLYYLIDGALTALWKKEKGR